ncbi:hypothetical protein G7054_g10148 [Neopestalotiopsis clavispora]|nr:hypothetical protein G7054_g10148 [Neopestalotiopsis clavispora]
MVDLEKSVAKKSWSAFFDIIGDIFRVDDSKALHGLHYLSSISARVEPASTPTDKDYKLKLDQLHQQDTDSLTTTHGSIATGPAGERQAGGAKTIPSTAAPDSKRKPGPDNGGGCVKRHKVTDVASTSAHSSSDVVLRSVAVDHQSSLSSAFQEAGALAPVYREVVHRMTEEFHVCTGPLLTHLEAISSQQSRVVKCLDQMETRLNTIENAQKRHAQNKQAEMKTLDSLFSTGILDKLDELHTAQDHAVYKLNGIEKVQAHLPSQIKDLQSVLLVLQIKMQALQNSQAALADGWVAPFPASMAFNILSDTNSNDASVDEPGFQVQDNKENEEPEVDDNTENDPQSTSPDFFLSVLGNNLVAAPGLAPADYSSMPGAQLEESEGSTLMDNPRHDESQAPEQGSSAPPRPRSRPVRNVIPDTPSADSASPIQEEKDWFEANDQAMGAFLNLSQAATTKKKEEKEERYEVTCVTCKFVVFPQSIAKHLQNQHQKLQPPSTPLLGIIKARIELQERIVEWTRRNHPNSPLTRAAFEKNPNVPHGRPHQPPFQDLSPVQNGWFACNLCDRFVANNAQKVIQHADAAHTVPDGGDSFAVCIDGAPGPNLANHGRGATVRENVSVQQLFGHKTPFYFEVARPLLEADSAARIPDRTTSQPSTTGIEDIKQCLRDCNKKESADLSRVWVNAMQYQPDTWLDSVGWKEHLNGISSQVLTALLDTPWPEHMIPADPHAATEQRMLAALYRAFNRAFDYIASESASGRTARFAVMKHAAEYLPTRPFETPSDSTLTSYIRVYEKSVRYWFRTRLLSEEQYPDHVRFVFPHKAQESWDRFVQAAQDGTVVSLSGTLTRDWDHEISRYPWQLVTRIEYIDFEFIRCILALFGAGTTNNENQHPILSALAVMGQSSNGNWLGPQAYTKVYSGAICGLRALVMLQSHFAQRYRVLNKMGGPTKVPTSRPELVKFRKDFTVLIEEEERSLAHFVNRYAEPTLYRTSDKNPHPVVEHIFSLRNLGNMISRTTPNDAEVKFNANSAEIICGKTALSLDRLTTGVQALLRRFTESWSKITLVRPDAFPSVDIQNLREDFTEKRARRNFLDAAANEKHILCRDARDTWLLDQVYSDPTLHGRFFHKLNGHINVEEVQTYGGRIRAFLENLFAVCHLLGGLPARATEISQVRVTNESESVRRNLFLCDGSFLISTGFAKGRPFPVLRFLPDVISRELFYYLYLIRPFWVSLNRLTRPGNETISSVFLWPSEPLYSVRDPDGSDGEDDSPGDLHRYEPSIMVSASGVVTRSRPGLALRDAHISESHISTFFSRIMLDVFYTPMSIQPWRHIAAWLIDFFPDHIKSFLRDKHHLSGVDSAGDEASHEDMCWDVITRGQRDQFAHSKSTHVIQYGRDSKLAFISSHNDFARFQMASQSWHSVLLSKESLRELVFPPRPREEHWTFSPRPSFKAPELSTENLGVAEAFSLPPAQGPATTASARSLGRCLGSEPAVQSRLGCERPDAEQEMLDFWETPLDAHLVKFLDKPDARFRAGQKEVIALFTQHPDGTLEAGSPKLPKHICYLSATGSGKSLTFLLPAYFMPSIVTVVVVPFVSMQNDLARRCRDFDIPFVEWRSSDDSKNDGTVVFVTPEGFVNPRFGDQLHEWTSLGRMPRLVIDECHLAMHTIHDSFRPKYARIAEQIEKHGLPVLLLSATIPQWDRAPIMKFYGVPLDRLSIVQTPVDNPNIHHAVFCGQELPPVSSQSTPSGSPSIQAPPSIWRTVAVVLEFVNQYEADSKSTGDIAMHHFMVFTKTIEDAQAIHKCIPHSFIYFGRDYPGGNDGRHKALARWICKGGIMVATSALSHGLDISTVKAVFTHGVPEDLTTYMQQAGRTGRNGKIGYSVIVAPPLTKSITQSMRVGAERRGGTIGESSQDLGKRITSAFVYAPACRRATLRRVFQGEPNSEASGRGTTFPNCGEGQFFEAFCDYCTMRKMPNFMPTAETTTAAHTLQEVGQRLSRMAADCHASFRTDVPDVTPSRNLCLPDTLYPLNHRFAAADEPSPPLAYRPVSPGSSSSPTLVPGNHTAGAAAASQAAEDMLTLSSSPEYIGTVPKSASTAGLSSASSALHKSRTLASKRSTSEFRPSGPNPDMFLRRPPATPPPERSPHRFIQPSPLEDLSHTLPDWQRFVRAWISERDNTAREGQGSSQAGTPSRQATKTRKPIATDPSMPSGSQLFATSSPDTRPPEPVAQPSPLGKRSRPPVDDKADNDNEADNRSKRARDMAGARRDHRDQMTFAGRQQQETADSILSLLHYWSSHCLSCVLDGNTYWKHGTQNCTRWNNDDLFCLIRDMTLRSDVLNNRAQLQDTATWERTITPWLVGTKQKMGYLETNNWAIFWEAATRQLVRARQLPDEPRTGDPYTLINWSSLKGRGCLAPSATGSTSHALVPNAEDGLDKQPVRAFRRWPFPQPQYPQRRPHEPRARTALLRPSFDEQEEAVSDVEHPVRSEPVVLSNHMSSSALVRAPFDSTDPAHRLVPFLTHAGLVDGAPYIHPRPVSFKSAVEKANWLGYEPADARSRDVISQFLNVRHPGPTWLCYLDAPVINWVADNYTTEDGHKAWEDRPWHSYAIAVIKDRAPRGGKHLVVYDCDPPRNITRNPRIRGLLRSHVFSLYAQLRRIGAVRVWYNADSSSSDQGRCRELSLQRLLDWASEGDVDYRGPSDTRMRNCVEITRL